MNIVATIEARMTSSRLPGKVLLPVRDESILGYLINRLKKTPSLNTIVLATTVNKKDDVLASLAKTHGIQCYRADYLTNALYELIKNIIEHFGDNIERLHFQIPPNVGVIPPTSRIISYDLMHIADIGLSYASTSGLKFSCLGKPCFAMGPAHYAHKGFTIDPLNREQYYAALEDHATTIKKSHENAVLAMKYWYFYAFHAAFNTGTKIDGHQN